MQNDDLEIQEINGEATGMTAERRRKDPEKADVPFDVSVVSASVGGQGNIFVLSVCVSIHFAMVVYFDHVLPPQWS